MSGGQKVREAAVTQEPARNYRKRLARSCCFLFMLCRYSDLSVKETGVMSAIVSQPDVHFPPDNFNQFVSAFLMLPGISLLHFSYAAMLQFR